MRKLIMLLVLTSPGPAFAADGCVAVSPSRPVYLSISAQEGKNTISLPNLLAIGNLGAPNQPSETFIIQAGSLSFSVTPVASCNSGVRLRFHTTKGNMEVIAPWDAQHILTGKAGTNNFVSITVHKIKA